MLDSAALEKLVEQQVKTEVADRVAQALNDEWIKAVESNAINFIQDRIVAKFANSSALPELLAAVKSSVKELFMSGQLPGLGQYVDHDYIKKSVDDSTQNLVQQAINELSVDPTWIEKIETLVNQTASQKVLARLSNVDIRPMVREYVDQVVKNINLKVFNGISSQTDNVELTVMDEHVVVEHNFTAKDIEAVESLTVKNLVVKGTVNTDNRSWDELSETISKKSFEQLNTQWRESLVQDVAGYITEQGINFNNIKIGDEPLINDGKLASTIVESRLRSVGALDSLTVNGDTKLNNTVSVLKRRVGINTDDPEMALSLWDEEVAVIAGKFKSNVGYIGTARNQALIIGVNKTPSIEISDAGLTAIKKLQVGVHRISHGNEVPNYSGTKGDIVFNANPTIENPVFAWQCLGGFRWKLIKAVE